MSFIYEITSLYFYLYFCCFVDDFGVKSERIN